MKKLLITALMLIGLASSALAQEVIFNIMKTDGSINEYLMNRDARIYYSDTQILFFDGNATVSVNLSEIRKAYFTELEIVEQVDIQTLTVYPNPANDILRIGNTLDNQEVTIYSINGKVMKKLTTSGDSDINISDLRPGIYVISTGNSVSKFVKM